MIKKLFSFLILGVLALTLVGCPVIPKWSRIQKNATVPLETFKEEEIKKNAKETDPRYKEHRYDYRSTIEGLPAADASFWLKINRNNTYVARAEFNMIPPWTTVFNAVGRQQIKGRVVRGRFVPREVSSFFKVGKKTYEVLVTYPRGGGAPKTTMKPRRKKRDITPINPRLLAKSYDITSALLTLMAQYQRGGAARACTQGLLTWDGFRLSRIKLKPDKSDAGRCTANFERVGGFLKKFEKQAKKKPATLVFNVDKRFALPVRISADTAFIQPALILTAIDDIPISYYYLPDNLKKTPFDE